MPLHGLPELFIPADHRRVWNALHGHVGKDSAIGQAALAEKAGLGPRKMRDLIWELIVDLGKTICTRYGGRKQAGYFLPASQAEIDETVEVQKGHALKILRKISALKKTSLEIEIMDLWHQARKDKAA